ncbi:hypothetical protein DVH24_003394 [Malus domestica]|uniref:Uncharacterized protein n=1 Tax=Malus domestica TaxID=3750 RepID=A0A498IHP0_MALDO|nr:hypothetical protein DVH24_003394 [Malus domestica]
MFVYYFSYIGCHIPARVRDVTIWYQSLTLAVVCQRGRRAPKGGGLGVIFKCIFTSLPSMRPFGSSLAPGSIGTPKLSECAQEQSHDG